MTADRHLSQEARVIFNDRALRKVIVDPDLSINNAQIVKALNGDRLGKLFPLFNSDGLDEDRLWSMYFIVAKIDSAISKISKLKAIGKTDEAEALSIKVGLVLDIEESKKSDLGQIYEATGGSLNMCVSFLGLKGEEGNKKWVDFIIRTWGKVPVYPAN